MRYRKIILVGGLLLMGLMAVARGEDAPGTDLDLDHIVDTYINAAAKWEDKILEHAKWLFWAFATISFVITMIPLMLSAGKSDLGTVFEPVLRWVLVTGIFWWLLINGGIFAEKILASFLKIGDELSTNGISPMQVLGSSLGDLWAAFGDFFSAVTKGFKTVADANSPTLPTDAGWRDMLSYGVKSIAGFFGVLVAEIEYAVMALLMSALLFLTCAGISILLALIVGKLAVRMIGAYVFVYIGCFYMAFGGASFTREMTIAYFRHVLGVAINLLATMLIIGVGTNVIRQMIPILNTSMVNTATQITQSLAAFQFVGVLAPLIMMVMAAIMLYELVKEVPPMLQAIAGGHSTGGGAGMIGGIVNGGRWTGAGAAAIFSAQATTSVGAEAGAFWSAVNKKGATVNETGGAVSGEKEMLKEKASDPTTSSATKPAATSADGK